MLASASPVAATIIIEKLMMAMTHGVGPLSGRPSSKRRSAGEAISRGSITRLPPLR